ncbi:MAG: PKD domain-containing protein, partial [Thermoplasmata archaeon]
IWYSGDYDVWLWDWVMGVTSDPSGILEVLTTMSIGSSSDIYWSDPTFDALYNLSLVTIDPAARQDIFDEMQTMAYWNLGCQCVAYASDNYGVSTLNWDPDSLGDWNTQYYLLPDISAQWPSMQMQPNNNHAPYFTGYTGMDSVVIAEVGVSESFTASGLDDDPLTVKEYRWFWGDGDKTSWSTSGSATHTYAEDGVYEVWVAIREASSSNGFEDYFITSGMATVECYDMSNYPPTGVSFTVDPTDPDAGSYVTFTGTATDPDGDDLYYTWDFGDGHSDAGQVVEYQFGAVGSFTVTLSVTDNRLGHGTRPVTYSDLISVAANQPPTISVSDFADIPVKETRTYTVTASDPEDSMEFTWIWGDGDVSVTSVPSADHMYNVKGTYDLTVWADDLTGLAGHRVPAASHVYVYNPQTNKVPVISGFSADDITPSTWQEVTFTGSASDLDGDPLTFTVEFGDGSFYVESFGPNSGESITVTAEHTYESSGAKTARMYVSDGAANRSSGPLVVTV